MKEQPTSSHKKVAEDSAKSPPNKPMSSYGFDQSFSDDEPGNLVIDLDASIEKSPSGKTAPLKSTPSKTNSSIPVSPSEHLSSVDKGLKLKIKRKNVSSPKPDSIRTDLNKSTDVNIGGIMSGFMNMDKRKTAGSPLSGFEKDKSIAKGRGHKKERNKDKRSTDSVVPNGSTTNLFLAPSSNRMFDTEDTGSMFKKRTIDHPGLGVDPYDFNAKTDDEKCPTGMFTKKIKTEKVDTFLSQPSQSRDACVSTSSVATATEPECLGPCEPGTHVNLEGIVWQETENGMLVVNVTWRGKTYVGTLLDATKHDWAPPRLSCDSPTSDLEALVTPKGRGKRGRGSLSNVPLNDMSNYSERKLRKGRRGSRGNFQAPPSPAKSDISIASVKRKGRPADLDLSSSNEDLKAAKRSRSCSRGTPVPDANSGSPVFIECPEPDCNKKYRHINGLRYHQTHAHQVSEDPGKLSDSEHMKDSSEESPPQSPCVKDDMLDNDSITKEADIKNVDTNKKRNLKKKETSVEQTKSPIIGKTIKIEKEDDTPDVKMDKMKKDIPVSSAVVTVTDSTVVSTNAQVFQISAAPIGCLGGMAVISQNSGSSTFVTQSTSHVISSVTTGSVPMVTVATMVAPVATITPPVVSESFKPDINSTKDKKVGKSDKGDKSKINKGNRPIVPAPPNKAISLNNSVSVTASNVGPVTTYTPISTSSMLKPIQPKPTVMGETTGINPVLAGLKSDKRKKKRKETKAGKDGDIDKKDGSKVADSSKSTPPALIPSTKPVDIAPKPAPSATITRPELSKNMSNIIKPAVLVTTTNKSDTQKLNSPPTSLNLPGNVLEKKAGGEMLNSPAYSDISDEGAFPLDGEIHQKALDIAQSEQTGKDQSSLSPFSGYSYYGNPPFLMRAASPASCSPRSREESVERIATEIKKEPGLEQKEKESKLPAAKYHAAETSQSRAHTAETSQPRAHTDVMLKQQFLQHVQQQLMASGVPQQLMYQYLAQYQFMYNDPSYRQQYEKFLEEHQLHAQKEAYMLESKKVEKKDMEKLKPVKVEEDTRVSTEKPHQSTSTVGVLSSQDKQTKQKQLKDQKLSQMLPDRTSDPYDATQLMKKQEEDLNRFYLFQKQRQLEHQKLEENRKQEVTPSRNVPELKPMDDRPASKASSLVTQSVSPKSNPKVPDQRKELSPPDGKKREETKTSSSVAKRPETPKNLKTPPFPTSASNSPTPAVFPASYMQPYYPGIPYDPSNPYRSPMAMGYSTNHAYMHPGQMRYLPSVDMDKEKSGVVSPGKQGDSGYFGSPSQHKIHELKEQAKQPATGEKSAENSSFDKHRDSASPPAQRHLHTHHHTHVVGAPFIGYDPYGVHLQPGISSFVPKS